jgi:hypothetical protein
MALLLICLGLLLLTGFLTVATETFTHLLTGQSWWSSLREFMLGSWLFALTACGWAATVWGGLHWWGHPVGFAWVLEVLAFAHLPLLVYPLTIFPTIGYRLEQILRLSVFLALTWALLWRCEVPLHAAALMALPGWLAHFLIIEFSMYRRSRQA